MERDNHQIDPLYDKKENCPFCKHTFTTRKVRSRFIKPLRTESDFGPVFSDKEDNNPLFYFVTVCPQCGFSFTEVSSAYFGKAARERITKEIKEKRDKNIDFCGVRDFNKAVASYKLGIYSAQVAGEKHYVMANLCLRLAWVYRGFANISEEVRFLSLALSEFELSYFNTDFNPENTPELYILYMVGELSRKLGKPNEAVRYFSKVIDHPEKSRHMKYVTLARQQWQLTVENLRSNNGV